MATLTGPTASYSNNYWTISNNYYDVVAGTNWSVSGTYNPANVTTGLKYSWNMGNIPANGVYIVHAFPSLAFGQNPWSTTVDPTGAPFPIHLTVLKNYTV